MSQIKVYGLRTHLQGKQKQLSDIIHGCVVEALSFPENKRAHRFIPLEPEDFYYPEGRTAAYIIIEILMITGRTVETKKKLIKLLFQAISEQMAVSTNDIEIVIIESPASHWGFRGKTGDEIELDYKIEV